MEDIGTIGAIVLLFILFILSGASDYIAEKNA